MARGRRRGRKKEVEVVVEVEVLICKSGERKNYMGKCVKKVKEKIKVVEQDIKKIGCQEIV